MLSYLSYIRKKDHGNLCRPGGTFVVCVAYIEMELPPYLVYVVPMGLGAFEILSDGKNLHLINKSPKWHYSYEDVTLVLSFQYYDF